MEPILIVITCVYRAQRKKSRLYAIRLMSNVNLFQRYWRHIVNYDIQVYTHKHIPRKSMYFMKLYIIIDASRIFSDLSLFLNFAYDKKLT